MIRLVAALAALALVATSAGAADIRGDANWREPVAPLPGNLLEVELLDVPRTDAPAIRIARTSVSAGTKPISFTLPYDPGAIDPSRTYSVAARLYVNGALAFRTGTVNQVLTRGAGDEVSLLLVPVQAPSPTAAELVGDWLVYEIAGKPVWPQILTSISFGAPGMGGNGGCNSFTGEYAAAGSSLSFSHIFTTKMVCEGALGARGDQEDAFFRAMNAMTSFRFEGVRLAFVDASGAPWPGWRASAEGRSRAPCRLPNSRVSAPHDAALRYGRPRAAALAVLPPPDAARAGA